MSDPADLVPPTAPVEESTIGLSESIRKGIDASPYAPAAEPMSDTQAVSFLTPSASSGSDAGSALAGPPDDE